MELEQSIRQAVILAGGRGTRLASELQGRPKPLVDLCGKPLLEWQVLLLKRFGYQKLLLLVDFEAEQIRLYCKKQGNWGLEIRCIEDGEPRGTAGAVLAAYEHLDHEYLVMYGDTMLDVDLDRFGRFHHEGEAEVTLLLHPNDHPQDSDLVELDDSGYITAFHGYPHDSSRYYPNLVSAALYVMRKSSLETWRDESYPLDFGKNLFPKMLKRGVTLKGYKNPEYIKDVGTPSRLAKVRRDVQSGKVRRTSLSYSQPTVFLDRDGTLNKEVGHLKDPSELELLPNVAVAIKRLNESDYRAIVVTNQPVIARGECSLEMLRQIHYKLETELSNKGGAYVDEIYFCPHHPDGGFPGEVPHLKTTCDCRKPNIGMISRAVRDFNVDRANSWFIGDATIDVMTAKRAGLKSILVETGYAGLDYREWAIPDFICPGLSEAVDFLLDVYPNLHKRCLDYAAGVRPGDVVRIGGLSRTGKSTFANALCYALQERGLSAVVLSLDRWLLDESRRRPGIHGRYDIEAIERIVCRLQNRHTPITLVLPAYDKRSRTSVDCVERIQITPYDVVLFEGIVALNLRVTQGIREHLFYVELNEVSRRARVLNEYKIRGMSEMEALSLYEARQRDETPYVLDGMGQLPSTRRVNIAEEGGS